MKKIGKEFLLILIIVCLACICGCSEDEVLECDHIFTHYKLQPANCTEAGHKAYDVCDICGYSTYEEIPALGHELVDMEGKEAEAFEDGYTNYKACKYCDYIEGKEVIPMIGHYHTGTTISTEDASNTMCARSKKICDICGVEFYDYDNLLKRKEQKMQDLNILLVGNSYTNYNTLMTLLSEMIKGQGYSVNVEKFAYGAQYLYDYLPGERGDYYKELLNKTEHKRYDVVFLQEQSSYPAVNYDDFKDSVIALRDYFEERGATVILYETWSYRNGYSSKGWSYNEMSNKLTDAYAKAGQEASLQVSKCGSAFRYMFNEHNEINLNCSENQHPNALGTYLVSLVHMSNIYGIDPRGVNYKFNDYIKNKDITFHNNEPTEIDEATQRILEEAAYEVWNYKK